MESVTWEQSVCDGITPSLLLQNLRKRLGKTGKTNVLDKGRYISEHFAEMAADTMKLADEAMEGLLVLPGSGAKLHFVGNPPCWRENPFNDNEYTFHLNRLAHWKTLAEAYAITGEYRYAAKVREEWLDWIDRNPCPSLKDEQGVYAKESFDGLAIWRALEVGIRGYRTWPIVLELLIDSGAVDEELLQKLMPCLQMHCRVLYEISPLLWPHADHNHYLMENLGLMTLACVFPELRGSAAYLEHSQRELDRCIAVQCTPCGGQIEGCASYHNGCVFWFALRPVIAARYGLTVPENYLRLLRTMFSHSLHATRSCGGNFAWGDSHVYPVETMSLAAVACYMAFGEREYLAAARQVYSRETLLRDLRDNLFRLGQLERLHSDLEYADTHPFKPDLDTFAWQRELDQVYFRSGWDSDDISVMTACRTPVQNLHAHIDAGTFELAAYGSVLVCDPGIYTYRECEERHSFKGSLWHSCLTVDRRDMWDYLGSWKYGPQREGRIIFADSVNGISYALSRHHNYHPAVMTRLLAMIDNRLLLVLDMAQGLWPDCLVEIGFHLDCTELEYHNDGRALTKREGLANLLLAGDGGHDSMAVEQAQISTAGDMAYPSTILRFQKRLPKGGGYRHAALLLPLRPKEHQPVLKPPRLTDTIDGLEILIEGDGICYRLRYAQERLIRLE